MSLRLVRIEGDLPEGVEALRVDAEGEGHRHMTRLAQEWASGAQRFDGPGEALIAAYVDGELAGVGGITAEPAATTEQTLRMRRLYVARAARRQGVAGTIATALLQGALPHAALITVHAGSDEASAFWMSQGFAAIEGQAWSHAWRPV